MKGEITMGIPWIMIATLYLASLGLGLLIAGVIDLALAATPSLILGFMPRQWPSQAKQMAYASLKMLTFAFFALAGYWFIMDSSASTVTHQMAEDPNGTSFVEAIMLLNVVYVAGFWIYKEVQNHWNKDWVTNDNQN